MKLFLALLVLNTLSLRLRDANQGDITTAGLGDKSTAAYDFTTDENI